MGFNISRYQKRIQREFEVEVVTPMFLGGANVNDSELRTPSLKGMLRFWWRLACSQMNVSEMKKLEDDIFGSNTNRSSASFCLITKGNLAISKELETRGKTFTVHKRPVYILDYLSYGMHKYVKGHGNVYHKEHIKPGSVFYLKMDVEEQYEKEITKALSWLIHYGGIGARSRNGFGSIATKIERPSINCASNLRDYTANSTQSKLFQFKEKETWSDAHSEIGLAYRTARLSIEKLHSYEKRKLVSAPLTVYKKNEADLERHAKPYFMHINKLNNGKFQGQILYVPYNYLSGSNRQKTKDYQKACDDINKELIKLSGGAK